MLDYKSAMDKLKKEYTLFGLRILVFFQKHMYLIIALIATILALTIKYLLAPYQTNDIVGYVFNWINQIKQLGFSHFYEANADYSTILLFIYAIISVLPQSSQMISYGNVTYPSSYMYYVKSVDFAFDILWAVGIFLIVNYLTKNKLLSFISYIIAISLPVQIVNSSVWGNNDTIYVTCLIYIVYFFLISKHKIAFVLLGVALGIKMQAVFILPFVIYLILTRKTKLHYIVLFVVGIFITFLPAYVCGASFNTPFEYMIKQVGGYSKLTLGCPNFWQLVNFANVDIINNGSTLLGLLFIGIIFSIVYCLHIENTKENLLYIATFLCGVTVFFLPHMHERYFYILDVMVVLYALCKKERYYYIILMQISSGIAYYHYLSGHYFIDVFGEDSVHIAAFINLFVLSTMLFDLTKLKRYSRDEIILKTQSEINNLVKEKSK